MNLEVSNVQAGLEKAEEPEIKLPSSIRPSKKQEFQKNIYLCFIDYTKAFLWNWIENCPFPILWPLLSFQNLLAYLLQHFHSIKFL